MHVRIGIVDMFYFGDSEIMQMKDYCGFCVCEFIVTADLMCDVLCCVYVEHFGRALMVLHVIRITFAARGLMRVLCS